VSQDLPSYANADEGTIDNFLMICSINFAITSVVMAGKRDFFVNCKVFAKITMKSKRQNRLLFSGRTRWAEIKQSVISVWKLKTQQFLGVGRRTGFTP